MFPTTVRLSIVAVISIFRFSLAGPDAPLIPSPLARLLPDCARSCLSDFIQTQLSGCSDPTSFECLCRARSATGYTLAEGALACVADTCPFSDVNSTTLFVLYNACNAVPHAASITHATLVAPLATVKATTTGSGTFHPSIPSSRASHISTSFLPHHTSLLVNSTRPSSAHSKTKAMPTTTSSAVSSTTDLTTSLALDTSTPPVPPTSTSATSSAASAFTPIGAVSPTTGATGHTLSGGQVAGIAVASVFTAAVAIGLLAVIFCSKRRYKSSPRPGAGSFIEKDTSVDLERNGSSGDAILDSLPETPLISRPAAQARAPHGGAKANQFFGLPAAPNQHRQSWWNRIGKSNSLAPPPPPPPKPDHINVRYLAPSMGGVSSNASPKSVASYHTTSKLLPDKPLYRPTPPIHEKRCSGETSQDQPVHLAEGVGLRIIAATPEPQGQQFRAGWPLVEPGQRGTQGSLSTQGGSLRPQISDPFIARTGERHGQEVGLAPAFRATRNGLPRLDTSTRRNMSMQQEALLSRPPQNQGIPNFRSLVNARPPQLPQSNAFSPITPGFVQGAGRDQEHEHQGGSQQQKLKPIMDRPRGSSSPFFSSQQSQFAVFKQPRKERKKSTVRPETHYTTSSDTEFEDDESPQAESRELDEVQQPNGYYPPRSSRTGASVNGLAELPALSPVVESPVGKKTPSSGTGTGTAHTPSPLHSGISPNLSDNGMRSGTPLSKIRYPEIPGSRVSPKREVKHVNVAMGPPIELDGSSMHSSTAQRILAPVRNVSSPRSKATSQAEDGELSSDAERTSQTGHRRLQPSPLRPRAGQGDLRGVTPANERSSAPPMPASAADLLSASALKFHNAASRLAASNAGRRAAPESALGNWPVQPVRPVLRPTLIPAPVGAPAYAGSQPSTPITPIDDAAFSPTNAGPYAVAAAVASGPATQEANTNAGHYANPSADGGKGSDDVPTRVLIPGAPVHAMRMQLRDGTLRSWGPNDRQQQQQQAYQGPRLSMGPFRHTRAPSRETDRERFMRLELQRLRAREQERRREREIEQAGAHARGQWEVQAALM